MSTEQRRYTRHATNEEIIYSSMDMSGPIPQRIYHPGILINKSQGGLAMRVTNSHKIEDTLWLEGIEGFSSTRLAAIKWVKELEVDEIFEVGLQL